MIHRLHVLLIAAVLALLFAPGCVSKVPPALTAPQPTAAEVDQVRRLAGRLADSVTAALAIADDTGDLIDAVPLAPATKDAYDCAVLRVTGTDQPSATVASVCGVLPSLTTAPLTLARTALQAVATCPSLRATTAAVLLAIEPLIAQLAASGHPSLVFAASALRTTFAVARALLEGRDQCSA